MIRRQPEAGEHASAVPAHAAAFDEWPVVRARVLELARGPAPLLVVTDFDGTLAPISLEPAATRMVPLGRRALRRLARIAADRPDRLQLAVLSGRTALDVATRVRIGGLRYLGIHGIEGGLLARGSRPERLAVELEPDLLRYVGPARAIGEAVATTLGRPDWLVIEQKGPSVAFHFRLAPDPDAARTAILGAIDAAEATIEGHGLARLEGRRVIEFRPEEAGGKGRAVERLIEHDQPSSAVVLGDDRTDAEAFGVIASAHREGRLAAALAIAVHGASETPAEVVEAANLVVPTPDEAARVLSTIAAALEREGPTR